MSTRPPSTLRRVPCPRCEGSGMIGVRCRPTNGNGWYRWLLSKNTCPDCEGRRTVLVPVNVREEQDDGL